VETCVHVRLKAVGGGRRVGGVKVTGGGGQKRGISEEGSESGFRLIV
jgi:hypothetical protein